MNEPLKSPRSHKAQLAHINLLQEKLAAMERRAKDAEQRLDRAERAARDQARELTKLRDRAEIAEARSGSLDTCAIERPYLRNTDATPVKSRNVPATAGSRR